ncbi:radical SAM protein [Paraliomyxa miuraensis]|uniref:radical SAM protein n=1 Tax=Paraliomyxa miuraensis TaxID=376150 RepID=UPI00225A1051|nr:radical SAM protein [Paraliomyxa miuraensis]MCX4239807.1 radical SAM protein [Paraliomyxa miuraensis]
MPGLLDVILGYDCNLACDYCTITPAMRARALPRERVLHELSRGRRDDYDALSLTGGEPTIRSDLLILCRAARRLGYGDVKLQTNGLLLAVPGNLGRLREAGVSRVHLSIHTHRADRYDALVRREGSYSLMCQGLDAAVASGLPLVVEVILKTDTYPDLVGALRWLHARGVVAADLWFVSLTDGNATHVASMPRMTEVVPVMAEAFAFARAHGMQVRSLHVPRCLLGDDHEHAHDPGAARVRVVTPEATFELRHSRLTGQLHVPACEGCTWQSRCPGVREDYLRRYGDAELAAARGQPPTRVGTAGPLLPVV